MNYIDHHVKADWSGQERNFIAKKTCFVSRSITKSHYLFCEWKLIPK